MSRNLKAFLQEEISYSSEELIERLEDLMPGRSLGHRFVTAARCTSFNTLVLELDDDSQYKITCEKLT